MAARIAALMAAALTAGCAAAVSQTPVATPIPASPAAVAAATSPAAPAASAPEPRPAGVHPVTATDLGASWRPGCPVGPADLRRVELDHLGNDGILHRGNLVVHRDVVDDVIAIFADLVRMRYPIERIRTVEHYPGAGDEASMRDNNTSAFNCRGIPGSDSWSLHAYGRAIDVNPKVNPYVPRSGVHEPANAGPWVDRSRSEPGMLHDGDAAVLAFTDHGWRWGGHWRSPLDYQHFEIG